MMNSTVADLNLIQYSQYPGQISIRFEFHNAEVLVLRFFSCNVITMICGTRK